MGARREQVVLGAVAAAVLVGIVAFAASTGVRSDTRPPRPTPANCRRERSCRSRGSPRSTTPATAGSRPRPPTCTAIAAHRSFPDGAGMRTIVLATEPDPLVIDQIGDISKIEGPAVPVLRSLRIGVR